MTSATRALSRTGISWVAVALASCGGAPTPDSSAPRPSPPPSASVAVPVVSTLEPPAATLRTGRLAPRDGRPLQLEASARQVGGGAEYLRAEVPPLPVSERLTISEVGGVWVKLESSGPALAFVAPDGRGTPSLWIRRATSAEPARGSLYTPALPSRFAGASAPGHRFPLTVRTGATTRTDPGLEGAMYAALASHLELDPSAFSAFASARLRERIPAPTARDRGAHPAGPAENQADLSALMDTMTGRLSVQLAVQRDRPLYTATAKQKATLPIEKVTPPRVDRHDWARLRGALGRATPEEPLARATPASFYFVRARQLGPLLDVLGLVDDWGQPVANVMAGRTEERGTSLRYRTELGLERTGLARILGPELVAELALVGSDPYVNEGTDVTLLMRPKSALALDMALSLMLKKTGEGHGALVETAFVHEGVAVQVRRSEDGRVRQHRATVSGVELVSNSPGAIRQVISAALGKAPRLSDELDFLYMLARDAGTKDDVLGYLGERFIETVVGPRQKIAEARRQLALAELLTPGFAALLYGLVEGKSPSTTAELVKAGWLKKADLGHRDGALIEWQPGRAARSRWGTVEAQEPLIDLPEPTRVTRAEEAGYLRFASEYEQVWSDAIDPVALRLRPTREGGQSVLSAELRVLPLLRREYRDLIELVGKATRVVPPLTSGGQLVAAIGRNARLRRELTNLGSDLGLGKKLTFDWLGDWLMVGVASRNEVPNALRLLVGDELEPPDESAPGRPDDLGALLGDLPVYAGIELRSRLGATAMLGLVKKLATDVAGGIHWEAEGSHRGNEIVRVAPERRGDDVALYYALLDSAFVVSLSRAGLQTAIDRVLDSPPRASSPVREGGSSPGDQVVLDLAGAPGSALHRSLVWLATRELLSRAQGGRAMAEVLLRGAPDLASSERDSRSLMRSYFGTVSLTPEGRAYRLSSAGIEDPLRGTYHAPEWPPLPVPDSPVDRTLSRLASLRAGLSFEDEPGGSEGQPLQSLLARVRVELYQAKEP